MRIRLGSGEGGLGPESMVLRSYGELKRIEKRRAGPTRISPYVCISGFATRK